MITSTEFRSKNTILTSRKIVNKEVNPGDKRDFVDLNGDGALNCANYSGRFTRSQRTSEPVLSQSMATIKEYGDRRGEQVLTQKQLPVLSMQLSKELSPSESGWQSYTSFNLSDTAQSLEPLEKNVRWAVDTTTNEFLVYKPKSLLGSIFG